jgi:integrase
MAKKTTTRRGGRPLTRRVKVVRRKLADGSFKDYFYPIGQRTRKRRPAIGLDPILDPYLTSPEVKRLAPETLRQRRLAVERIRDRFDFMRVSDLNDRRVVTDFYAWRDEMAGSPVMADRCLEILRHILNWARKRGMIETNHAADVDRLTSTSRSRADKVWARDEQAALLENAPPYFVDIFELALYTGAREADVCTMRWDQIKDGWLTYTPAKTRGSTGLPVTLPINELPPLKALLARLPRVGPTILVGPDGKTPWCPSNVRQRFRKALRTAFPKGLDRRFHDIRGTTSTRLAEASCTDVEIASITGHKLSPGMLARYLHRSKAFAASAYKKWAQAEFSGGARVVQLKGFGKRGKRA